MNKTIRKMDKYYTFFSLDQCMHASMHDLYTPFEDYQSQDYTDITFRPLILLTTGIERA